MNCRFTFNIMSLIVFIFQDFSHMEAWEKTSKLSTRVTSDDANTPVNRIYCLLVKIYYNSKSMKLLLNSWNSIYYYYFFYICCEYKMSCVFRVKSNTICWLFLKLGIKQIFICSQLTIFKLKYKIIFAIPCKNILCMLILSELQIQNSTYSTTLFSWIICIYILILPNNSWIKSLKYYK